VSQQATILFDGVCNLCNGFVQFVIKHGKGDYFSFAALQSEYAHQQFKNMGYNPDGLASVVLIENNKVYTQSTAALRILKRMKGLYPLLYAFIIVPSFIRDAVYKWIAKNRYKWFGKTDTCMIPTPELKSRFFV
jgi:predicted DCC family thiol-disulfide oxidoreductase YuxK